MPSNIITGDLLIMVLKIGSTGTATTPTGWTLLSSRSSTGNSYIYYKISDGTESATVNVTVSTAHASAITYRISNYEGTPEASFAATNVNDPPSLTTSWSSTKNLFIAACTTRQSNNAFTAAPTNYSNLKTIGDPSSGTTTHVRLATATCSDPCRTPSSPRTGSTQQSHCCFVQLQSQQPIRSIPQRSMARLRSASVHLPGFDSWQSARRWCPG